MSFVALPPFVWSRISSFGAATLKPELLSDCGCGDCAELNSEHAIMEKAATFAARMGKATVALMYSSKQHVYTSRMKQFVMLPLDHLRFRAMFLPLVTKQQVCDKS
jgi:hypothetical protein